MTWLQALAGAVWVVVLVGGIWLAAGLVVWIVLNAGIGDE